MINIHKINIASDADRESQPNNYLVEKNRFSDPWVGTPKKFELHLRTKVPKAISKCQGKSWIAISATEALIVHSFGNTFWADRNTGKNRTKYSPLYIYFQEKCLKNFGTEKFYGPRESCNFNSITAYKDTCNRWKTSDKVFLTQLGVKFT